MSDHARNLLKEIRLLPHEKKISEEEIVQSSLLWFNFIKISIQTGLHSTLTVNTVGDNFEPCNSNVCVAKLTIFGVFLCFLNVIMVPIDSPALVLKRQYLNCLCIVYILLLHVFVTELVLG